MSELKNREVYRKLKEAILSGVYEVGHRFPRESEFAETLHVGKVTLRWALAHLESDGLVDRLPRLGTFVKRPDAACEKILAVIPSLAEFSSPHHYILPGVTEAARICGCKVSCVPESFFLDASFDPAALKANGYTGILVAGAAVTADFATRMKRAALPCVIAHSVENCYVFPGTASVRGFENCWYDAIKHLIGLGHRRIGVIVIDRTEETIRFRPKREFQEFMEENGIADALSLVRYADYFQEDTIRKALRELLENEKPPTAILCHSDFVAIKVLNLLRSEWKMEIPRDIALMGYCGFPGAALLNPPLSTVEYNYAKKGAAAVELLRHAKEWYDPEKPGPEIRVMHTLIPRESTEKIILSGKD